MSELPNDLTINGLLYRRVPVTVPEEPPPPAPRLTIIARDLDSGVGQILGSEATLDGARKWAITVDAEPPIKVVSFAVDGKFVREEKTPPYSLAGDTDRGTKLNAWDVPPGVYMIDVFGYLTPEKDEHYAATSDCLVTITAPAPDPTDPPPTEEPAPTPAGVLTDAEVADIKAKAGPYAYPQRTHQGNLTVKSGETVEGVIVTGKARVERGGVLRNFVCTGGNVEVQGGLVEFFEITNPASGSGLELQDPGDGALSVARYGEIHHLKSDGIKIQSHARLKGVYVHHLGMGEQSHADGIQARAIGREVTDVVVEECVFDMPSHARKGVQGWRDNPANWPRVSEYGKPGDFRSNAINYLEGVIGDYLFTRSHINGGNFSLTPGYNGSGVRYTHLRVGRDYNHGPRRSISGTRWTPENWHNVVWADTGEPTHKPDGELND